MSKLLFSVMKGLVTKTGRGEYRVVSRLRGIDPATLYHYLIPFSRTVVWYLIGGVRMWRVAFQGNRLTPRSSNTSLFECRKFLFVHAQFIKDIFFLLFLHRFNFIANTVSFLSLSLSFWKCHIIYFTLQTLLLKKKIQYQIYIYFVRNVMYFYVYIHVLFE